MRAVFAQADEIPVTMIDRKACNLLMDLYLFRTWPVRIPHET